MSTHYIRSFKENYIIGDTGTVEEEDPLALSPRYNLDSEKLRNVIQINEVKMKLNQTKHSTQIEIDSYVTPPTDETVDSIKNKFVLLSNNNQNEVTFSNEKGDDGVQNNICSQANRNDKLALTCSTDVEQDELHYNRMGGIDLIQDSNCAFCKQQLLRSKSGQAKCKYMLCNHTQNIETELKYNKLKRSLHYNFPLKNHKSILTGQPSYQCDMCNHQNTSHILHNRIHIGDQPYKCDVCKHSFNRKSELIVHTRIHPGERPHQCDVCKQSFNEKRSLINTHIDTGERPFQCDLCEQSFYQKSNLNRHTRMHTEKRPYQCDLCKQSFCRKSNLNRHSQTHTGERPYQCELCNQSFNQKGNLKIHARTHTGERLYKCDVCKQTFKQRISLLRHTRTHAGNQPISV